MTNRFNNSDDFDTALVPGTTRDITDYESKSVDNSDEMFQTLENLNILSTKLSQINKNESEKNLQNMASLLTQMFLNSRLNNNIKLENIKSKLINRLGEIYDTMTAAEITTFLTQIQTSMNDDVNRAVGGGPLNKGIQVNINNQDNRAINHQTNNNIYAPTANLTQTVEKTDTVSKIVEAMSAFKELGIPNQNQIGFNPAEPINTELKSKEVVAEFVEKNQKEDNEQYQKMLNED